MAGDKNKKDDKSKEESLTSEEIQALKDLNVKTALKQRIFCQIQQVYDMIKQIETHAGTKELFLIRAAEIDLLRKRYEEVILEKYQLELLVDPTKQFDGKELDSFDDLYYRVKLAVSKAQFTIAHNGIIAPRNHATNSRGRRTFSDRPISARVVLRANKKLATPKLFVRSSRARRGAFCLWFLSAAHGRFFRLLFIKL